jgi:hypothetical protein
MNSAPERDKSLFKDVQVTPTAAVGGHGLLDGPGQVRPQVPAVADLDCCGAPVRMASAYAADPSRHATCTPHAHAATRPAFPICGRAAHRHGGG